MVCNCGSSRPGTAAHPWWSCHGFPELANWWRHQIPVLAEAGYHVLAPDQRGYGGSSRPEAIEAYDIHQLTADIVGVLDDVGAERAVWVGHDWGAVVVLECAAVAPRPRRGRQRAERSTPAARTAATDAGVPRHVRRYIFYILYFQEPGVADAELNGDPARTMRRMMGGLQLTGDQGAALRMVAPGPEGFIDRLPEPQARPDWISQDELDHYITEFTRTGFTGGLNWYRNMDRNWEITPALDGAKITVPCLFIGGTADPVWPSPARPGRRVVGGPYQEVMIDGAGHWLQQERPEAVNSALFEFSKE